MRSSRLATTFFIVITLSGAGCGAGGSSAPGADSHAWDGDSGEQPAADSTTAPDTPDSSGAVDVEPHPDVACVPDCGAKECGDDGCGGSCGECPGGGLCLDGGVCQDVCVPDCKGPDGPKECGSDGCGGSCGECPGGAPCLDGGVCLACAPDCEGKDCGDDGCGGICGDCQPGYGCEEGVCVKVCVPDCAGKDCGDDGCDGSCGDCLPGFGCEEGVCIEVCVQDCDGKDCGDDGCGGSCGSCAPWETCVFDSCVEVCVPLCADPLGNPYECGEDGCGGSCGTCAWPETCQGHLCVPWIGQDIPFGGECQYLEDCQPELVSGAANPDFPFCNWDQCADGGPCSTPYCTKYCVMHKDTVDNATGQPESDGVEDDDTPQNDCSGAADGPVGTVFRCVALLPADQPNPVFQCLPGTDFQPCTANADCPGGETCQLAYINGEYSGRCMTAVKSAFDGGVPVGKECNSNVWDGSLGFCSSDLCFGVGCVDFCTADAHCATDQDATCTGGACSNNPSFGCQVDTDCSAWQCQEDFQLFADDPDVTFDLCFSKECQVSQDCADPDYFCRFFFNGEDALEDVAWEYLCLPKPAGSVAPGEPCDPFWQDDVAGPECGGFCVDGFCSAVCLTDADCAADQICTVQEYGYDQDGDDSTDKVLPYQLCQSLPGSQGYCTTNKHCALPGEACVVVEQPSDGDLPFELQGHCADLGDEKGVFGDFCGWGIGTQCKSGICLYFDQEAGFGLCTEPCTQHADCPGTITLTDADGSQDYKSVCSLMLWGYNGTLDVEDNLFLNFCWVTDVDNSLQDCSVDHACTVQPDEACLPYVHSQSPELPAVIEYNCVSNIGTDAWGDPLPPPTQDIGEGCDPDADGECVGIFCLDDIQSGVGYCSALCQTNADCGNGTKCVDNIYLPRPDMDNAAIFKLCRKAISCIPCQEDWDCSPGYACVNVGGLGLLADFRCAPACEIDQDCDGTDGGGQCLETFDQNGQPSGKEACVPSFCPW